MATRKPKPQTADDATTEQTATVTLFANQYASECVNYQLTLADLEESVRGISPRASKAELPWLKLAKFGDRLSEKGCVRCDANVDAVCGIEVEHDAGTMPLQTAVDAIRTAGIACLFYTSASHTPEKPRWRALCLLANPIIGTEDYLRERRRHWCGVLNALVDGALTRESFVLSQSYYFGRVDGKPIPEVVRLDGVCIDQIENAPAPRFPINGSDHTGNGASGSRYDPTPDADLRAAFMQEDGRHDAMLKLSARWAARGMAEDDIAANLNALLDECPNSTRNDEGRDHRASVKEMAESAVRKIGETRASSGASRATTAWPKLSTPSEPEYNYREHMVLVQELLDRPAEPTPYLVQDLLVVGGSSLLVGRPKNYKSTLAAQIAIALSGNPELLSDWADLGRIDGNYRVGMIDLEQSEELAGNLFKRFQCPQVSHFPRLDRFPPCDEDGVRALRAFIAGEGLKLVIIDSLARIMPSPPKGLSVFQAEALMMQRITDLAHESGCHILVICHQGKRDAVDDPLTSIAGTNALPASADDILVFYKDEDDEGGRVRRKLFIAGRNIAKSGIYVLEKFDTATRFKLTGADEIVTRGEIRHGIVQLLNNRDGVPLSAPDLVRNLDRPRQNVYRALQQLVADKLVAVLPGGKYTTIASAAKRTVAQAIERAQRAKGKRK